MIICDICEKPTTQQFRLEEINITLGQTRAKIKFTTDKDVCKTCAKQFWEEAIDQLKGSLSTIEV